MRVYFDKFTIDISLADARYVSHPGSCDQEVAEVAASPKVSRQLDEIGADKIRAELDEYGAWDDEQLSDDEQNRQRIVWIACGNICNELTERKRA